jgi:hypothetical protein
MNVNIPPSNYVTLYCITARRAEWFSFAGVSAANEKNIYLRALCASREAGGEKNSKT